MSKMPIYHIKDSPNNKAANNVVIKILAKANLMEISKHFPKDKSYVIDKEI